MRIQRGGVAQHAQRIVAGEVERHEFAAGRGDVGDQPAGARGDDGAVAGSAEDAREPDRAGIGGADFEAGHHDQHGERIRAPLRGARLGIGACAALFGRRKIGGGQARH